jgi:transcription initiation factor TFIID subunit 2
VLLTCYVDVRLAGISALIDFQPADGSSEDLEFLLDIAENDPEPKIRHEVIRMLIETPPFELAAGSPVDTPTLASRLWNNIKYVEVIFFRPCIFIFF